MIAPGLILGGVVGALAPVALIVAALTLSGCQAGSDRSLMVRGEEQFAAHIGTIRADAYSFNARIWRDGKPTTFKLQLYRTDSLVGLSGTGYLGKGALRGWISRDSILVHFPASKEYVYEDLSDLGRDAECPMPLASLNVLQVLSIPPDSIATSQAIVVLSDYSDENRPEFEVAGTDPACPWTLEIVYDHDGDGWRIRKFDFSDGNAFRLRAERARFKADAEIPPARFQPDIPGGTVRISP
jgi:hypothetical protein